MDLSRFHLAQRATFATAIAELRAGHKQTHWMWFIFPQLASLGRSATARQYGITGLAEARAYLSDPVLGPRLLAAVRAVLGHKAVAADAILGPVDALKLRSCATLFEAAGGGAEFGRIIDRFCGGQRCPLTLAEIAAGQGG